MHLQNNDASLPSLNLRIQALEKSGLGQGNLSEQVRLEIHGVSNSVMQTAKNDLLETQLALEMKLNSL